MTIQSRGFRALVTGALPGERIADGPMRAWPWKSLLSGASLQPRSPSATG